MTMIRGPFLDDLSCNFSPSRSRIRLYSDPPPLDSRLDSRDLRDEIMDAADDPKALNPLEDEPSFPLD